MNEEADRCDRLKSEAGVRAFRLTMAVRGIAEEFPDEVARTWDLMNEQLKKVGLSLQSCQVVKDSSSRCESVRVCQFIPGMRMTEGTDFRCDAPKGHKGPHLNCTAYPGRIAVRWLNGECWFEQD